jgi:hypothetical protein
MGLEHRASLMDGGFVAKMDRLGELYDTVSGEILKDSFSEPLVRGPEVPEVSPSVHKNGAIANPPFQLSGLVPS